MSGRQNALIMRAEPGLPLHLILRSKITSANTLRLVLLRAHRFTAADAKEHGIVDIVAEGGNDGLLRRAGEMAKEVGAMAKSGRYYSWVPRLNDDTVSGVTCLSDRVIFSATNSRYMKQTMYREAYRTCLDYTDEEAESWTKEGSMYGRLASNPRFAGRGAEGKL